MGEDRAFRDERDTGHDKMTSATRQKLRLVAVLGMVSIAACACGSVPVSRQSTAKIPRSHPSEQAIDLFGATAPPLLRVLGDRQAGHLPKLSFTYGPTYQHGRVIGLVISYPGCEQVEGATVTETATKLKVTVLGTPSQGRKHP